MSSNFYSKVFISLIKFVITRNEAKGNYSTTDFQYLKGEKTGSLVCVYNK